MDAVADLPTLTERADDDAPTVRSACFEAAAPGGGWRLEVDAPAHHAAGASIALQRADALLAGLQQWSGIALDWRWVAAPSGRRAAHTHAYARWSLPAERDGAPLQGVIELPWTQLRALPAPDAGLAGCLRWPALPVVLSVSRLRIDADELALLEPGGALLLPESFAAPWQARLRAAYESIDAGVPVLLPSPALPQLVGGAIAQPPDAGCHDARIACEVRLATPRALPADRLAGWFDGEPLADVGTAATLWRVGGDRASRLAVGKLMPWGDGWALAVETLHEHG